MIINPRYSIPKVRDCGSITPPHGSISPDCDGLARVLEGSAGGPGKSVYRLIEVLPFRTGGAYLLRVRSRNRRRFTSMNVHLANAPLEHGTPTVRARSESVARGGMLGSASFHSSSRPESLRKLCLWALASRRLRSRWNVRRTGPRLVGYGTIQPENELPGADQGSTNGIQYLSGIYETFTYGETGVVGHGGRPINHLRSVEGLKQVEKCFQHRYLR
jgi:hypothetical protein